MTRLIQGLAAAVALSAGIGAQAANVTLGSFAFDSTKFGDTVAESDGGAHRNGHWLNVVNANPGLAGALTGANFDTGVANIGEILGGATYTIGYAGGIANHAGADLGIVVARYSTDNFDIAFDGGPTSLVNAATAVYSGENRSYFYGGNGPYSAGLYVHLIDLSDYGVALGDSIGSVSITGIGQLDLIRAAGLAVPEADSAAMLLAGLGVVGLVARRRMRG